MHVHHEELIDVRFQVDRGLAWITIDRPECLNAFRARTVDELIRAFKAAWVDSSVGVVALTGAGDRAFCVGGDQLQRQETGDYGPSVPAGPKDSSKALTCVRLGDASVTQYADD
jgi:naphthoate synthase